MAMASASLQSASESRMSKLEASNRFLESKADRFQRLHDQQIAINNLQVRINKELAKQ